ncbi:MAG TPA: cupin domain-containing protein [Caulobacteraceae bacterium]|jgi:hypothetical protein
MRSLADLMAPAGVEAFLQAFAAKQRLMLRTDTPGRGLGLLDWRDIDAAVAGQAPPERLKVLLNSHTVDPRMYVAENPRRLRGARLQELAEQGASLLINGVDDVAPRVAALVTNMERQLRRSVSANAYLSFGPGQALAAHYDDHDVVVLQVIGAKRWRCYGVDLPFPVAGGVSSLQDPVWEDELRPGDVLYLPRGEAHAATAVEPPSVHLTIAIQERTGVDYLRWLADEAAGEQLFRMSLRRDEGLAEAGAGLRAAMQTLAGSRSLATFLTAGDHRRAPRPLAAFDFAQRATPDSLLVSALRRSLDLELGDDEERTLEIGGERRRLGALARRALSALTERDRTTLADLAAALGRPPGDAALAQSLALLARHALIAIDDAP